MNLCLSRMLPESDMLLLLLSYQHVGKGQRRLYYGVQTIGCFPYNIMASEGSMILTPYTCRAVFVSS